MPTGGGKSLCYQIPALVRQQQGHGVTIVVSPLIALMHDQVGALDELGVKAAFLNSTLSMEEANAVERKMMRGELTLVYAAPERITTPRFLDLLDTLKAKGQLSLFAIDEAHCVSQWAHDFRPEYRALALLHERYAGVPRVALTATADGLTQADIVKHLQLEEARQFVSSFDRPNIRYTIAEKKDATLQLLRFIEREHAGEAGIVYCQSRKRVEEIAAVLCREGMDALPYHAGLDAATRRRNQDRFLREDGVVMTATIAFGMGIDKPDVRFVAHLDLPKNIEGYYQETGRAGRDGLPSDAWMANGLHPPAVWDGTEAARMLLSTIYRVQQASGITFGAGHIMDILRGRATEKVHQFGHEKLSTFGIGAQFSEQQLRGVLRQLIATGALSVDASAYNTLHLTPGSRAVLKGEQLVQLRESINQPAVRVRRERGGRAAPSAAAANLTGDGQQRFAALKAWRSGVAKEHNLPAYVIFHDATLAAIAAADPRSLDDMEGI